MDKLKQWFKDIKHWFKSKTIWFNGVMGSIALYLPEIVEYLLSNPDLWQESVRGYFNVLLIIGNIYLRTITKSKLSDK